MTDIEQKALALLNKAMADHNVGPHHRLHPATSPFHDALCRAIEQHEAFRRDVSDAVEAVFAGYHDAPIPWVVMRRKLEPFIIAKPVDPLVEAISIALTGEAGHDYACEAEDLRAAMKARGYEFTKIGEGA